MTVYRNTVKFHSVKTHGIFSRDRHNFTGSIYQIYWHITDRTVKIIILTTREVPLSTTLSQNLRRQSTLTTIIRQYWPVILQRISQIDGSSRLGLLPIACSSSCCSIHADCASLAARYTVLPKIKIVSTDMISISHSPSSTGVSAPLANSCY